MNTWQLIGREVRAAESSGGIVENGRVARLDPFAVEPEAIVSVVEIEPVRHRESDQVVGGEGDEKEESGLRA